MSSIPETWKDVFNSNGEPNLISADLLVEMLKKASDQSKSYARNYRATFTLWELRNYRKLVTFIFEFISELDIDDNFVKFNTCDLYEEFLLQHVNLVKSYRLESDLDALNHQSYLKNKALLNLLVCIMISTKVSSTHSIKHLTVYSSAIKKFGYEYSKEAITKSEMAVMKTVNYKLDQCPLYSICPLLILTLVYNEPTIDGKLLYQFLHKTMDYYYLAKADILLKLFDEIKESRKIDYEEFKRFTADSMLISCALVAVTATLVDEQSGPQVLKELVYITCYSQKDIEMIRNIIVKDILDVEMRSVD